MLMPLAGAMLIALVGQAEEPAPPPPAFPQTVKLVKRVSPEYPEEAHAAGLGGLVRLECVVDARGRITSAKAVEGPPPLRPAAVAAVKKWRYEPPIINGVSTAFVLAVTINFQHDGRVSIGKLIECLESKDEFIRESAAATLGLLGSQAMRAASALMRATKDESERVRQAAQAALDRVGGKKP